MVPNSSSVARDRLSADNFVYRSCAQLFFDFLSNDIQNRSELFDIYDQALSLMMFFLLICTKCENIRTEKPVIEMLIKFDKL